MSSSIGKRIKHLANKAIGKKIAYNRHKFTCEEAQHKYTDQYSEKAVVVERVLAFDDPAIHILRTVREVKRHGWRLFLSYEGQAYEELVREFYPNLKEIEFYPDGPHISSKQRRRHYIISPTHFSSILHLPVVQDLEYHYGDEYDTANILPLISKHHTPWTTATYPQQELKDEYHILNIVFALSLIPQKCTSDVTVERATLLVAIMTSRAICARRLIREMINSHLSNAHNPAALPFGLFITKCARQDGVRIAANEKMLPQEK